MWQPPAYSPLTHYFYTMAINEPHIYKVKLSKPCAGHPEVGQQFGNAIPTERNGRLNQMIPNSGNLRPSTSYRQDACSTLTIT